MFSKTRKNFIFLHFVAIVIILCFSASLPIPFIQQADAQSAINLPSSGTMVHLTPAYNPVIIRGLKIYPRNPLRFDFVIDPGHSGLNGNDLKDESQKLIKYFLAALTIPEREMWVNLSPYERDRIIPDDFGRTEMGKDLLIQDYLLKQLTASLMYPEDELGEEFWNKVYKKAMDEYGTTDMPINTFNKVWIVPETATVFVHEDMVFVEKTHLKVMLEDDYLAMETNQGHTDHGIGDVTAEDLITAKDISTPIVRELLIPEIEKEVNEGKTFSNLRQIVNSMILAEWYKQNLKKSLLGQSYVDQGKTNGLENEDSEVNRKIYDQYVTAYKKGAYNYIKEDYDQRTQKIIPRKYFSGGIKADIEFVEEGVPEIVRAQRRIEGVLDQKPSIVEVMLETASSPLKDVGNKLQAFSSETQGFLHSRQITSEELGEIAARIRTEHLELDESQKHTVREALQLIAEKVKSVEIEEEVRQKILAEVIRLQDELDNNSIIIFDSSIGVLSRTKFALATVYDNGQIALFDGFFNLPQILYVDSDTLDYQAEIIFHEILSHIYPEKSHSDHKARYKTKKSFEKELAQGRINEEVNDQLVGIARKVFSKKNNLKRVVRKIVPKIDLFKRIKTIQPDIDHDSLKIVGDMLEVFEWLDEGFFFPADEDKKLLEILPQEQANQILAEIYLDVLPRQYERADYVGSAYKRQFSDGIEWQRPDEEPFDDNMIKKVKYIEVIELLKQRIIKLLGKQEGQRRIDERLEQTVQETKANSQAFLDRRELVESTKHLFERFDIRPDPVSLLGVTDAQIEMRGREKGLAIHSRFYDGHFSRVLPYLPDYEEMINELIERYKSNPKINFIILGRDAELFGDAMQIVFRGTAWEDRITVVPIGQRIKDQLPVGSKPAEDFIGQFIDYEAVKSGEKEYEIIDTGFYGTIIQWINAIVRDRLSLGPLVKARSQGNPIYGRLMAGSSPLGYQAFDVNRGHEVATRSQMTPRYHAHTDELQTINVHGQKLLYPVSSLVNRIENYEFLFPHMDDVSEGLKKADRDWHTAIDPVAAVTLQAKVANHFHARRDSILSLAPEIDKIERDPSPDPNPAQLGGIDLNPENIDLKMEGESIEFSSQFIPNQTENHDADGYIPFIINITPITNILLLLGESNIKIEQQLTYISN